MYKLRSVLAYAVKRLYIPTEYAIVCKVLKLSIYCYYICQCVPDAFI